MPWRNETRDDRSLLMSDGYGLRRRAVDGGALLVSVLLALGLIVYGNAKAYWDLVVLGTTAAGSAFGGLAGVFLAGVLAVLARVLGLGWGELGLERANLRAAVRLGARIGGLVAVLAALALFFVGLI